MEAVLVLLLCVLFAVPALEDLPAVPVVFFAAVPAEFFFTVPAEAVFFAVPAEAFFAVPAEAVFFAVPAEAFLAVPAEGALLTVPAAWLPAAELLTGVLFRAAVLLLRVTAAAFARTCLLLFPDLLILSDCLLSSTG